MFAGPNDSEVLETAELVRDVAAALFSRPFAKQNLNSQIHFAC
jgi:hypothetical protein